MSTPDIPRKGPDDTVDGPLGDGDLLVFPTAPEPIGSPASDLPEMPAEVGAWLEHTRGDGSFEERLMDLARDLAAHGPAAPARHPSETRSSPRRAILLAAAAVLLGVLAWRQYGPASAVIVQPAAAPTVAEAPVAAPVAPPPAIAAAAPPEPLPAPAEPVPAPRPVRGLRRSLVGDGAGELAVVSGVDVVLDGTLELGGTERAPHLRLEGTATFDVTPGAVSELVVDSAAAHVRVLGTRFTVAEGMSETRIAVERGKVSTRCVVGSPVVLEAAQEHLCPRPSALGMRLHLERLQKAGAPPAALLEVAEKGLSYPVRQPDLHGAFHVARMKALLDLGRAEDARAAIRTYLASGATVYRPDVEALAARADLTP